MNKGHLIGALLALLVNASLIIALANDEAAWQEFKSKFGKNYTSPEEELLRMKIYLDNKLYVESNNLKSDSQVTFTQGINHLSDLTAEEIIETRCGFRQTEDHEPEENSVSGLLSAILVALNNTDPHLNVTLMSNLSTNLDSFEQKAWYDDFLGPETLDYRKHNRVSKVKDQGSCGSCWAFATTGALESLLASHDRGILLSEQNLVDCSGRYGNHGCNGGLMDLALRYVRDHGIMSSHEYPYVAKDGPCKFKQGHSVMRVRGSARVPRGNEAILRMALTLSGPLPVAIDASAKAFHSYQSGVYNDRRCRSNNLNHAVLLVGYGTDKVGGDYWIVKNSWGDKWGDSGYIKMARNRRNLCGIASYAIMPIP